MEADEYYFEPGFLRGTPGQELKLEIENESSTLHSFAIPEQKLDMDIPPKKKVVVEVTFPSSGAVRFFCKSHPEVGMEGELMTGNTTPGPTLRGTPTPGTEPNRKGSDRPANILLPSPLIFFT